MNKLSLAIPLCLLLIGGCSSWRDNDAAVYKTIPRVYLENPLGVRQASNTGDIILHSWPVIEQRYLQIHSPATVSGKNDKKLMGTVGVGGHEFKATLNPGRAILMGIDRENSRYFVATNGLTYKYGGWNERDVVGGVVIPNDNSPAKVFWHPPEDPRIAVSETPEEPIDYTEAEPTQSMLEFEGFGQTITYLGVSGGQIHFVYREFKDRMIRDAFTQEFRFDYVTGKEYGYKGSRFVVHDATDSTIDYTVTKWFEQ